MPVTKDDIENFSRFASQRVGTREAESLAQLVSEWEAQCAEYAQTVDDVRQGQADYDAGKGKPAKKAFADIRAELE